MTGQRFILTLIIIVSLLAILPRQATTQTAAVNIEIDTAACYGMFDILEGMKSGDDLSKATTRLDSVLSMRAYKTMFRHYNRDWRPNHLPQDVFKRMILSLRYPDQYMEGENRRAEHMLPKWRDYYDNPDKYEKHLQELEGVDIGQLVLRSMDHARSWLPPEMTIGEFYFFIHPNGGSPGFVIDDSQGYDFFQLPRDDEGVLQLNVLGEIIAHECHHLGLETPPVPRNTQADSIAFYFLEAFVGEGTANKFINNCGGGRVPRIDADRMNTIMDPSTNEMTRESWEEYTRDEDDLFKNMVETFDRAAAGELTRDQLDIALSEYWITGMMPRVYFVGSELFGAIYFGFGKEGCYEVMRDPRKMFDYYNKAIEKRSDVLAQCPKIPQSTVDRALSIGRE
jgi:hypothetical protein